MAAAVAACGAPGGGSPTAAAPPVSTSVTSTPVTLSASSARPVRSLTGVQAGPPKTDCQLFGACAGRALFLAGFPPRPGLSARLGQRDAAR